MLSFHGKFPRSSEGRALYRESGPSQDGDLDTGNLPFFFFNFIFFSNILIPFFRGFLNLLPSLKIVLSVLVYSSFHVITIRKGLLPLWQVYPFPTLFNWGHASEHCWVWMNEWMNVYLYTAHITYCLKAVYNFNFKSFNIIKLSNIIFVVMLS